MAFTATAAALLPVPANASTSRSTPESSAESASRLVGHRQVERGLERLDLVGVEGRRRGDGGVGTGHYQRAAFHRLRRTGRLLEPGRLAGHHEYHLVARRGDRLVQLADRVGEV